jgi:hypothetical protein
MSEVLLAPYLPLRENVRVGPWALVRFSALSDTEALPDALRRPVMRLVEAYESPFGSGAVLFPAHATVGAPFDRSALAPLRRALLAGVVANNPYMAVDQDDQDANAGHAVSTAENAILWGHPLTDGNSYVLETGVLARTMAYHRADPDKPLPPIAPPVELPSNLFAGFDEEVSHATHSVITSGGLSGRRLLRALDWYLIAYSNAEAVTFDVRISAARSAVEVLTGAGDGSRKIVRALGRLLGDETTPRETRTSSIWTKHRAQVPVQLTPDEWWMARLCELRNVIVHGEESPMNSGRTRAITTSTTLTTVSSTASWRPSRKRQATCSFVSGAASACSHELPRKWPTRYATRANPATMLERQQKKR